MIALFLLSITAVLNQSVETLYIDQTVRCQIQITHEGAVPDSAAYKLASEQRDYPSFSLISSDVQVGDAHSTFTYILEPKQTGVCIFAPGFLPFKTGEPPFLLPAMQARCSSIKPVLSSLGFASLLPLYPEKKIAISTENRLRLLSADVIQRSLQEIKQRIDFYEYGWAVLVGSLIAVGLSMLLLWVLIEYELQQRRGRLRAGKEMKIDAIALCVVRAKDSAQGLTQRAEALCYLLRHIMVKQIGQEISTATLDEIEESVRTSALPKKEKIIALCKRLRDIVYGKATCSSDEIEDALNLLLQADCNLPQNR